MRKSDDLRVAVLGVGEMGSLHAKLLSTRVRGASVSVVSDPEQGKAMQVADAVGARVAVDPFSAIDAQDVDAVVIASPGPAHEAQVMACLERGKAVLCEKPLTVEADASYRIAKAEDALGKSLVQVGFMRRFDPEYVKLRQMIVSEELGPALMLHLVHRNVAGPEGFTSEMALTSSVVHEADTVRFLLGEEIKAVTVHCGTATSRAGPGVSDPMLVLFETESGRLADVEIFIRTGVAYEVRTELVAENGTARIGLGANVVTSGPTNRWGGLLASGFVERFGLAYEEELRCWVRAVGTGTLEGASAWDGYAAQAVCEAGLEALRTGGRAEVALFERPSASSRVAPA
jgi:myo-inositol 2-dehydrogenase / D-chiro-inositol 1-dehydrogenase